jgi:hypothetical protein
MVNPIHAIIWNGRIETKVPLDLPEGTKLLIVPADDVTDEESGWDDTPEGIAEWLRRYDAL